MGWFKHSKEPEPRSAEAYNNRGVAYGKKGEHDREILDYNEEIEINPGYAMAYNNRAVAYFYKKEYDKAWDDMYKAQGLGCQVNPKLIGLLRQATGRQR